MSVQEKKPSVALWHTGVVVGFCILLGLLNSLPSPVATNKHSFLLENLELIYLIGLAVEWALFGLVYAGVASEGLWLSDLIGRNWTDWPDIALDLVAALIAGFLILAWSALIGVHEPAHHDVVDLSPKTAVQFYFFVLFLASGGFIEEVVFRGYLLRQFKELFKAQFLSILMQAALFSFAHGIGDGLQGIAAKFFTGTLLGVLAQNRKSLIPGIIAHCGINVTAAVLLAFH